MTTDNAWALLRATLEQRFAGQPDALAKVADVIERLKNRLGNKAALEAAARVGMAAGIQAVQI
jgi:hypothetical protein